MDRDSEVLFKERGIENSGGGGGGGGQCKMKYISDNADWWGLV